MMDRMHSPQQREGVIHAMLGIPHQIQQNEANCKTNPSRQWAVVQEAITACVERSCEHHCGDRKDETQRGIHQEVQQRDVCPAASRRTN